VEPLTETRDIVIRREGRAGHITLNRPRRLNALTWDMCLAIERALAAWREDEDVELVMIDGAGERAFSAGGDLAEMYRTGRAGDYDYGRRFWRDEYRMNATIAEYPKPVVAFLHGFVMGGGVGVGCHGRHRIVGATSRVAMPECAIGLVPDVGGSLLLATAPGRSGEFLGVTGWRMRGEDALFAGFADHYIPEERWDALKAALAGTGDVAAIEAAAERAPESRLAALQEEIWQLFEGGDIHAIAAALESGESALAAEARRLMAGNAPLSMGCTVEIIHRVRAVPTIRYALTQEFRFTFRSMEKGDFLEGIRARIIDKDNEPRWRHDGIAALSREEVTAMLAPLGKDELEWEDQP